MWFFNKIVDTCVRLTKEHINFSGGDIKSMSLKYIYIALTYFLIGNFAPSVYASNDLVSVEHVGLAAITKGYTKPSVIRGDALYKDGQEAPVSLKVLITISVGESVVEDGRALLKTVTTLTLDTLKDAGVFSTAITIYSDPISLREVKSISEEDITYYTYMVEPVKMMRINERALIGSSITKNSKNEVIETGEIFIELRRSKINRKHFELCEMQIQKNIAESETSVEDTCDIFDKNGNTLGMTSHVISQPGDGILKMRGNYVVGSNESQPPVIKK